MAQVLNILNQTAVGAVEHVKYATNTLMVFLLPKWSSGAAELPSLRQLWDSTAFHNVSIAESMLSHFDVDGDGTISYKELLNMTEVLKQLSSLPFGRPHPETWWAWFSREWPLMDWKVGVFLWKSFGGILALLACLSIVPGRMHGISAKILRWPILGLTYFLVIVELMVYVVIRLGIRVAECLVARPKHRSLRRSIANAKSYQEWYKYAEELDQSQNRDRWLCGEDDHTSYRYNWAFIRELIKDMRCARSKGDSLLALAVIQQCTRKNVGGVMSEDLFSYSNTGEPKVIVKEFIEEVVTTLHWVTEDALKAPANGKDDSSGEKKQYLQEFQNKVRNAENNIRTSIWSTFNLTDIQPRSYANGGGGLAENGGGGLAENGGGGLAENGGGGLAENGGGGLVENGNGKDASNKKAPRPSIASRHHRQEVMAFLKRARSAYGRTALCLSGGSMMGSYHYGHITGMLETGTLPHIISGTSAGAVIAAIVCTRTDEEIKRDLNPDVLNGKMTCFARPWSERIKSVLASGNMFSFEEWMTLIKWFTCGDMTFEEAFNKTGRVFCITLSSTTKKAPPVLLNYITAPNVVVASAVVASAAVPGFVPAVRLQYKDANGIIRQQGGNQAYFDGSIRHDIPVNGLAEMLNCQFFITCQCNPHIVPFFYNSKGGVGRPSRWSSGTQEDSWRGGFLLAALEMYLKNDMKAKNVFLNDLEAAVGFTSTLLTQEFVGSTTIVPQVCLEDYFKLLVDPPKKDLYRYFQGGATAAYEHTAMIKLHYSIADALEDCLAKLDAGEGNRVPQPRPKFTIPGTRKP